MLGGASMHKDDYGCDFPGCNNDFNQTNGAKVAIAKDGNILTFCTAHSDRLSREGVKLRTLAKVHAEQKEAVDALERLRMKQDQAARESIFIQSLK